MQELHAEKAYGKPLNDDLGELQELKART